MTGRRGQYVVAIVVALTATARAQSPALDVPGARPGDGSVDATGLPVASTAGPATAEPAAAAAPANPAVSLTALSPAESAAGPSPSLTGQAAPASPAPSGSPGGEPVPLASPSGGFDRTGIEGQPLGRPGGARAGAGGQTSRSSGGQSLWWQTLGALALVIGLILAMRWVLRRTSRLRLATGGGQVIEVLSRTSISARQSLLLVRVGQHMLVVGAGETLTTLARIDDPTQVAELLGSIEQTRGNSLTNTFARALSQWRSSGDGFVAQLDEGAAADRPAGDPSSDTFGDAPGGPRTPAGGAADRLRSMAQKVRDVGASLRRRP